MSHDAGRGPPVYYTPPEIAELLRVSPAKVLTWIRSGELESISVASRGSRRPRFRISARALEAFERRRSGAAALSPIRRRRDQTVKDFV